MAIMRHATMTGEAKSAGTRLRKNCRLPAGAIASEDPIAAAVHACQTRHANMSEPSSIERDEQAASAGSPTTTGTRELEGRKTRSRKARGAPAGSVGTEEPCITPDEPAQVDPGLHAELPSGEQVDAAKGTAVVEPGTASWWRAEMDTLQTEIAALPGLPAHELRIVWRRLCCGEPLVAASRELLIREIAYKMQEQVHGGLAPAIVRRLRTLATQIGARDGEGGASAPPLCSSRARG